MSVGASVAGYPRATMMLQHQGIGPQTLVAKNNGTVSAALALFARRQGAYTPVLTDRHTQRTAVGTNYNADGTTTSFSGQVLANLPVCPGTFSIPATALSPSIADLSMNGDLYFSAVGARKAGSGGTFAAMAAETLSIRVDRGGVQTITFAGEGTITLAIAKINATLKGAVATAKDANNVNLESLLVGDSSYIEVTACSAGVTTKLGISVGSASSYCGHLDYFTGALTLALPGGYAPAAQLAGKAAVQGTVVGPFRFTPAGTLVVNPNAGGDATATFDAAAASLDGTGGTFAALAGEAFSVQFESGPVQTVTMGTEATIALAIATINSQISGGYCAAVDANNVKLISDVKGTGSRVRTSAVAAGITTKLGIPNSGNAVGTGDVADITAVTVAEVKTVVEADCTGITVTSVNGKVVLSATTSLKVNASSTLETIMGLSTATATTATGVGVCEIVCSYVQGELLAAAKQQLYRIRGMCQDDQLFVLGLGYRKGTQVQLDLEPLKV